MRWLWIAVFLYGTAWAANHLGSRPEWIIYARQLIGESEPKRKEALSKLEAQFPDSESLIRELGGEHRPYALDVLVALNRPGSVDKLMSELENEDIDGALTLAVNALVTNQNYQTISDHYLRLLQGSLANLSTPTIMAMVDFFTHLKILLPEVIYQALLKHSRLEVQQAAALHLDVNLPPERWPELQSFLPDLYPQVRAQIMLTLFEHDKNVAKIICEKDQDPIVQSACDNLNFAPTKPPSPPLPVQSKSKAKAKAKTKTKKAGVEKGKQKSKAGEK